MSGAKTIRARSIFDLVNIHYPNTLFTTPFIIPLNPIRFAIPLVGNWNFQLYPGFELQRIEEYIYKGLGIRLVCSVLQETRSLSLYMAARKFLTPLSHSLLTFTLDANPKSQARHSPSAVSSLHLLKSTSVNASNALKGYLQVFSHRWPSGGPGVFRKPAHHVNRLPF